MIGQQIGQYQITEIIGQGGMATVYKAYHPSTERYVALKVLDGKLSDEAKFLIRFRREARVIAHLEHRSIVPIYDYGEHDGMSYIVMRLIEHGTLRTKLHYKQLTLLDAAHIVEQVGEALDYAHAQGIIHRDLKPSNILLDEHNNAYLTDFGIAKMLGSTTQVTASGVVGTPSYMSPEQCQGKPLTASSDIYALGAIVYEIITGKPPYVADQPLSVMYMHVQDPIPSVRDVDSKLPTTYDRVIKKALAKRVEHRYSTARALAADFRRAVSEVTAPPQVIPDPGDTPPRREIPSSAAASPASEPVVMVEAEVIDDALLEEPEFEPAPYEPQDYSEWAADRTPSSRASKLTTLTAAIAGIAVLLGAGAIGLLAISLLGATGGSAIAPTLPSQETRGAPIVVVITNTPTDDDLPSFTPTSEQIVEASATAQVKPTVPPTTAPTKPPTNVPASTTPVPPTNTSLPPTVTPTSTASFTPTATLTLTPTLTTTLQLSGGNGLIAFTHGLNKAAEIATIDANGQGFKLLTDNNYYDGEPDWSPDGGVIAFESQQSGNGDIWVMTRFGTGLIQLTNSPEPERLPDWSPDGTKIVYESGSDGSIELYVMNSDGSDPTRLTNNSFDERTPQFSPDGTKILFMTFERGKWEIAVMEYPAGTVTIYDCPGLGCRFPSWSPDGKKAAYNTVDSSGNGADLYILDVTSGSSNVLLQGGENGRIMWAGDGKWMFLNRTVGGNTDLYRMDPVTLDIQRLTFFAEIDFGPDWTP